MPAARCLSIIHGTKISGEQDMNGLTDCKARPKERHASNTTAQTQEHQYLVKAIVHRVWKLE